MRDFDPTASEYAGRDWSPRTRQYHDIGSIAKSIAGPVLGGLIGSKGSSDAADTTADATRAAADVNREIYYDNKATNAPLLANTLSAQNRLVQLLGLNGNQGVNTQFQFDSQDLYNDPSYAFRMQQGQQALERSAAARGGLNSGAALKALTRYGQDYASTEYGNAYNRAQGTFNSNLNNLLNPLQSLAGGAQSAANSQSTAATNYGNANAGLISAQGNATAASQIAGANALGNSLSGAFNGYNQNQLLSQLLGGGSGGSAWNSALTNDYGTGANYGFSNVRLKG